MRILIDTNIFIYREDYHNVPSNLQYLINILNDLSTKILIHPLSKEEIGNDKDLHRKEIILSKIRTYPFLINPPQQETDVSFIALLGQATNIHDVIDHNLLYCVYKNAVKTLFFARQPQSRVAGGHLFSS